MKRILSVFVGLLLACPLFAQQMVHGEITDLETNEPLPFVQVEIPGLDTTINSNIEGRFSFNTNNEERFVIVSFFGYHTDTVSIDEQNKISIAMRPVRDQLGEVVILPGENPAHRIIQKAVQHRKKNNAEKQLDYQAEVYNKFYFTFAMDSLQDLAVDSSLEKAERFLEQHHLLLIESQLTRYHKAPGLTKEVINASKVSGLETPMFSTLVSEFQSFSFYNDFFSLGGFDYLNPLTPGSTSKYFFLNNADLNALCTQKT